MEPRTSVSDILSAAAGLEGHRVIRVRYYGNGPRDVVEWDFGNWHNPVYGVDFELDDHSIVSALWGDSFGHFSLEIVPGPVSRFLISVDEEQYGPLSWDVTHHPRWEPALSGPVLRAQVLWDNKGAWSDLVSGWGPVVRGAPIGLRLDFGSQTMWVLAGLHDPQPPPGRFYLGADEIMVVFERTFADSLGVSGLEEDPPPSTNVCRTPS